MHSLVDEIVTTEEEYVAKLHMLDKVRYIVGDSSSIHRTSSILTQGRIQDSP